METSTTDTDRRTYWLVDRGRLMLLVGGLVTVYLLLQVFLASIPGDPRPRAVAPEDGAGHGFLGAMLQWGIPAVLILGTSLLGLTRQVVLSSTGILLRQWGRTVWTVPWSEAKSWRWMVDERRTRVRWRLITAKGNRDISVAWLLSGMLDTSFASAVHLRMGPDSEQSPKYFEVGLLENAGCVITFFLIIGAGAGYFAMNTWASNP